MVRRFVSLFSSVKELSCSFANIFAVSFKSSGEAPSINIRSGERPSRACSAILSDTISGSGKVTMSGGLLASCG